MAACWMYILCLVVCVVPIWTQSIFKQKDLDVRNFTSLKCKNGDATADLQSRNYYRYLVPSVKDSNVLYIGAMNFLYKVDKTSMACLNYYQRQPDAEIARRCRAQGKSEARDCQNHIRVIMERESDLLICGTGAYSPTTFVLNQQLQQNTTYDYTGVFPCPFDPFDNYTAIQVSQGNPGDATVAYFATYTDFLKNSPVIYRERYRGVTTNITYEEKMTDREINTWLNAPQFVGSFDDSESVKFFFREIADEGKKNIYARVAKVCKYDLGGGHTTTSRKHWLSFQKARLVCSLPGDSPYFFNDIYDVYERDNQFYALFYRQGANLNASAICIYDINDINKAFNGKFQHKNTYNVWEAVEPTLRLNNCTALKNNPEMFTDQVSRYQLMNDNVDPMFGRPVYYINGVQLLQIAVSKPVFSDNGDISRNIYAASDSGDVYDVFMKNFSAQGDTKFITELNSVYRPFSTSPNASFAVWDMKFLNDDTLLGFGTDEEVANLNLASLCSKITKLNTCIRNTKCKWMVATDSCTSTESVETGESYDFKKVGEIGTMNSVMEQNLISVGKREFRCMEGVYATLPLQTVLDSEDIIWVTSPTDTNNCMLGKNCIEQPDKYTLTLNGDLVIMNVTSAEVGMYVACPASHRHIALTKYQLITAEENDAVVNVWKQSFNEWATEFNRWQTCSRTYFDSCPNVDP